MTQLPDIETGDIVTTHHGKRGVVNGVDRKFVTFTAHDDPQKWRIPLHRDAQTIVKVERNGRVIWPAESVQLRMFE